jgi:hypothetical protein
MPKDKCEHNVVAKYCFRCKRPDLAGPVPKDYQEVERIARKIMSDNGGIDEVDDPSLFEDICQALTTYGNARELEGVEKTKKALKVTADDVYKVGDHYWGGDYEPSYSELTKLTESYNEIVDRKFTRLQSPEEELTK